MTNVRGGGATPSARSAARSAAVIDRHPAATSASSCAAKTSGGTTRLESERPTWSAGATRWYIRTGTRRANPYGGPGESAATSGQLATGVPIGDGDGLPAAPARLV